MISVGVSPVGKGQRPEVPVQDFPLPACPGKPKEPDKTFYIKSFATVGWYHEKVILEGKEANTSGVRSSACTAEKRFGR